MLAQQLTDCFLYRNLLVITADITIFTALFGGIYIASLWTCSFIRYFVFAIDSRMYRQRTEQAVRSLIYRQLLL